MLELLDRAPDVTAVLAYNDLMAIGALRAVRRRGGSVPEDVSVVGFDDVALAAYVDPPLTTLSQSTAEMGYWAVARLAERLRPRASAATRARWCAGRGLGASRDAPGPARGPRLDRAATARLVGQGASTAAHLADLGRDHRAADPFAGPAHEDGGAIGHAVETRPLHDERPGRRGEAQVEPVAGPRSGRPPPAAGSTPGARPGTCRRRRSGRSRRRSPSAGSAAIRPGHRDRAGSAARRRRPG